MSISRILPSIALALSSFAAHSQSQWMTTLMANMPARHCSETHGTQDGHALVCQVWDNDPQRFSEPLKLEVYRNHQPTLTIQPGAPIREWHLWNSGQQIAIHTSAQPDTGSFRLYDTATGKLLQEVSSPSSPTNLPQWAKSPSQVDDESVPEGPAYTQQRTLWIAKVLRQIDAIHPGMTRRALESTFTTEGGIFTRTQQTYVYKGCPYIKVDIIFSPTGATQADDKIVTLSKPYLAFSVDD